jgi:hypothetical protein
MNLKQYNLPGTKDINGNRNDKAYQNPDTWITYQEDFQNFQNFLLSDNDPKVLLRVFDGELRFLRKEKVGNVGKRHVSVPLTEKFIKVFYENSLKCDKFSSHLTVLPGGNMHKLYKSVYGNKKIDYPMEFHYAIVLNKWIFKNFKNKIGLIGGSKKIKVIKELMKHEEYRGYLGMDIFTDYIEIPERYSCDNPNKLENSIKEQLKNSKAKIFLFGMGISKLAVAYKFKDFYPATYIDAGCAISALAGFIKENRPYAGDWMNFRIKNYDYSRLDPMNARKENNITYI